MKTTTLSEPNMSLPGHWGKSYGDFVKMMVDFNIWAKKTNIIKRKHID